MTCTDAPSVLFAEPDAAARAAVRALREAGLRVTEVATGAHALHALATARPDLVVLAAALPDLDAAAVCERLRADALTAAVPVLVSCPAALSSAERVRVLDAGAAALVPRPCEPRELVALARAQLRARRPEPDAFTTARRWQATLDALAGHAVFALDRAGRIARCNTRAVALLARAHRGEVLGAALEPLFDARFGPAALSRLDAALRRAPAGATVQLGGRWYDARRGALAAGAHGGSGEATVLVLAETASRAEPAAAPGHAPSFLHTPLADVRVLAVDPDEPSRSRCAAALHRAGAEVVAVDSADAARDVFARFWPDVLISAVDLPGLDGCALLRDLRAAGAARGRFVPALALTGDPAAAGSRDVARRASLAGFQHHAARPVDPSEIIARVTRLSAWSSGDA